ncbi:DBH-like monooxygenase protein 1 [Tubulanus polymorphus]|uniref:DBH-like monooxygenase protein 1 n=1 Tax=Tubulanus polymorphus TaxID=672921 RepID=UPI003DA611EB
MENKFIGFIVVLTLGNVVLSDGHDPKWRSEYLDSANKFKLEWRMKDMKVEFRVSVHADGWFGFGISPDGRMANSDVVVGWMSGATTGKLVDAHVGAGHAKPVADTDSNWFLTEAASTNQRLVFTFHRLPKTDDSKQDMEIKPGMTNVIWAYSDSKATSMDSISYHGPANRGSKSIEILPAVTDPMPEPKPEPTPSTEYPRKAYLDHKMKYLLEWKYDEKEMKGGKITFRVTVKTTGYVGFGLSENGAMKGSDIVIGWVNGGKAQLYDMHGIGNQIPVEDKTNNWNLKEGKEENGFTQLTFYRSLDTCDEDGDIKIGSGATRIIFSFNDEDPTDVSNAIYHGSNRGVRTLYLLDEPEPTVKPGPDVKTIELKPRQVTLTSARTTYFCSFTKMQLPTAQKYHAIQMSQKLVKGNEPYVHHLLVYKCAVGRYNDSILNVYGNCFTPEFRKLRCREILVGFAIGSHETSFPENVGMPIGGAEDSMYYMFETHYDNPEGRTDIVDDSGIEITYTSNLREQEAGTMFIGSSVSPLAMVIPPRQEKFIARGMCSNSCLSKALNKYTSQKEIHIFSVLGHAHLLGSGIRTRHFREGYELPWILNDMSYDFNYQTWRPLKKPVTIKSTDTIVTDCYYNSEKREGVTFAGEGTNAEMCYTVILYYPKLPMSFCTTNADTTTPALQNMNWVYKMGQVNNWNDWKEVRGKMMKMYQSKDTWSDQSDIDDFQERVLQTDYYPECFAKYSALADPSKKFKFQMKQKYEPMRRDICMKVSPAPRVQSSIAVLILSTLSILTLITRA